jgi:serine/threonine protein kinase
MDETAFPPLPPSVGPYEILDRLGSGAFAVVHRARHIKTRTVVAVKAISKESLHSIREFELLKREINVMRSMDHPFIATFYDLMDDDLYFYLVIELVENGNLLDFVNTNRGLDEGQARHIFYQIMTALHYLHTTRKVVHRDLKAENVLLDSNNNIRLVDFGLSKAFTKDNPFLVTACGSPGYVAPEVINEQRYTAAADIWSAGILLYAMVVGTLPFMADNVPAMLKKVLSSEPMIPVHLSPELRDLLRILLTKDPAGRGSAKAILDHAWLAEYGQMDDDDSTLIENLKVQEITELDESVVSEMKILGINTAGLLEEVIKPAVNERTAIYKMLRRKMLMHEIDNWQAHAHQKKRSSRQSTMKQTSLPLLDPDAAGKSLKFVPRKASVDPPKGKAPERRPVAMPPRRLEGHSVPPVPAGLAGKTRKRPVMPTASPHPV